MYQLIAQDLRERIESGELPLRDQLPTELKLRDRYGAARNTVRDAVGSLAALGLAVTKQGRGRSSPGGAFAYLKDTLGEAEAGHRDLTRFGRPTEDEARCTPDQPAPCGGLIRAKPAPRIRAAGTGE